MSDIDDLDDESTGVGASQIAPDETSDESASAELGGACLSCGAQLVGTYCISCGQKQDDLRKSLFLLGRSFVEDTFSFDSRMWRTLGLLAASPGLVPTEYSHGRRSRFTPPVRLFLIVSFLFFLTVGLTKTLFVGLEVEFKKTEWEAQLEAAQTAKDNGSNLAEMTWKNCNFQGQFRFLIKERDLNTDKARVDDCVREVSTSIQEEIEKSASSIDTDDVDVDVDVDFENGEEIVERVFQGISWGVSNPREFNDAFNDWLPRVMFFMTPILALILSLFLRRNALIFDHMVLSLYIHAVNFAIVGATLMVTQLGLTFLGGAGAAAIAIYYVIALKRAYGRGWVKTLWTAFGSSFIYIMIFGTILMTIVSSIVWNSTAG